MADVQEENPELNELWFVRCYVNGLREGIKFQIRPLRPQSLTDAYWLAKDVEPCHPPLPSFPKRTGLAYSNFYQKPNSNNVAQKFSTVSTASGSQTTTKQPDTYQKNQEGGRVLEMW